MRCKDAVSLAPAKNGFRKPCVVKNSARQPSYASREPLWKRVPEFRAGIQATKCVPPVTISNSLVLGLVEPGPEAYREKGRFAPPDRPAHANPMEKAWAYPVVANGRLYIRDHGMLWCYDVKRGNGVAER